MESPSGQAGAGGSASRAAGAGSLDRCDVTPRGVMVALAAAALALLIGLLGAACGGSVGEPAPVEPPSQQAAHPPAPAPAAPTAPPAAESNAEASSLEAPDSPGPSPMDVVEPTELVEVAVVFDGDTIELADGRRVRLVQIDTPEGGKHEECYAKEARAALREWVSRGTEARLVADPLLDQDDRCGRLLHYATIGGANINLELGRAGAATVWFVGGKRGAIADELLRAARDARTERRGLWGACPGTPFEPLSGAQTGPG